MSEEGKMVVLVGSLGPIMQVPVDQELQSLMTCRAMGIHVLYRLLYSAEGVMEKRSDYAEWGNA